MTKTMRAVTLMPETFCQMIIHMQLLIQPCLLTDGFGLNFEGEFSFRYWVNDRQMYIPRELSVKVNPMVELS